MNIKKSTLLAMALLVFVGMDAQVNLQTGSAQYTIPVNHYSDPLSKLSHSMALNYSSQQGLKVNEVASSIGTGWQLSGISFVTRLQRGLPDDQLPRAGAWDDTTKYPPGYLYNSKTADDGCPNAIAQYPIFKDRDTYYTNHNTTDADREIDYFMYNLNGRTGEFVIDKNWNVQLIDNAKVTIVPLTGTDCDECRTNINRFVITDENGLRYEFGTKENAKIHTYRPALMVANSQGMVPFAVNGASEIPLAQKPFVTQAWYADRITDIKSNRQIRFEYEIQLNDYNGAVSAQYLAPLNNIYNNDPTRDAPINYRKTIVTQNRVTVRKVELKKVVYPTGEMMETLYGNERKDILGAKAITDLILTNSNGQRTQKIKLNQQYFVKHEVKEPQGDDVKWARLCLTGVQRYGEADVDKEPPYAFEYYTGTNATEDFVPPYFFHAQDPWGYYNGSYSGVATNDFLNVMINVGWKTLCLYNNEEGDNSTPAAGYMCGIATNAKTNYAKNGLLKQLTGPYGGKTVFEYAQNKVNNDLVCAIDYGAAGGVHVSKVIQMQQNGIDDLVTEYKYINADGTSSLWGVEPPHNAKPSVRVYVPQSKYTIPIGVGYCGYGYKYPGVNFEKHTNNASNTLSTVKNLRSISSYLSTIRRLVTEDEECFMEPDAILSGQLNSIANAGYQFLLQSLVNCVTDYSTYEAYLTRYNNPVDFGNAPPMLYKRVEVISYSQPGQLQSGKTVHEFTSNDDFPLLYSSNDYPYMGGTRYYKWAYGLPKATKIYNNSGQLVQTEEQTYQLIASISTDPKTKSCKCETKKSQSYRNDLWDQYAGSDYATADNPFLFVRYSNIAKGRIEKTNGQTQLLDANANVMVTSIQYDYNSTNNQLANISTTDSKGTLTENRTYYLEDCDLSVPANNVLQSMYNQGLRNVPVATETWQTKSGGQPELISTSVTEYGTAPNGDYRPIKTYTLQTDAPVPLGQIGLFNPQQLIRDNNLIKPVTQMVYDAVGNAVQSTELRGNRTNCTVYDYANRFAVAAVSNATAGEVAYTSFEADGANSRWQLGYNTVLTEACPTGNNCLQLFYYPVTTTVAINKDYILSFWATTPTVAVNGATAPTLTGPTINGWTYYEYRLPSGSASPVLTNNINTACKIDELRLYPAGAAMATTTYAPGIGKTGVCDANNRIAYFTYDGLGRPDKEKDAYGNVVKTYEYRFKE